jgi:hypothetical protein
MRQLDWVARQAARQKRLMALRAVIQEELKRNLPFSEVSIRISLLMIRLDILPSLKEGDSYGAQAQH